MADQRQEHPPPQPPHSSSDAQPTAPAPSTPNPQAEDEQLPAPAPVEMTEMRAGGLDLRSAPTLDDQPPIASGPMRTDTATALAQAEHASSSQPPPPLPSSSVLPLSATADPATAARDRAASTAIGPSTDSPVVPLKDELVAKGPTLVITLLLTSGARHPFKLDGKYLQKRNVEVEESNPYNLSVYKLKELILREWREEWESKPASPSSIRLISFGKLLDDKAALKDARLSDDSANVLHMTIKPQDFVEEDDGGKAAKASFATPSHTQQRSPGCRCVIL